MDIEFKDLMMENNIREILQNEVNRLVEKYWESDPCKPIFTVSLLYDKNVRNKEMKQYIVLTCQHLNNSFSSIIYPIDENFYGYESLLSAMNDLYAQTM